MKQVMKLAEEKNTDELDYLNCLLYPEKMKGVKIPNVIPVPSCSFQIHSTLTVKTNDKGNLAIFFNPFFLCYHTNSDLPNGYRSSCWINNNDDLIGDADCNYFVACDMGQTIPPIYDQYRLVSGCLTAKYIGRVDEASGVIGGAILYDNYGYVGQGITNIPNAATKNPAIRRLGNFELARDSYYHQENTCLEGIKLLYFPVDNSYEEYVKIMLNADTQTTTDLIPFCDNKSIYKTGFNQFIYITGAPPSSSCFKIDAYLNFEGLPNATYLSYIPLAISTYALSVSQKNKIYKQIQNNVITKLNNKYIN